MPRVEIIPEVRGGGQSGSSGHAWRANCFHVATKTQSFSSVSGAIGGRDVGDERQEVAGRA